MRISPRRAKNAGVSSSTGPAPVDQPDILVRNDLVSRSGRGMKNGRPYGEQLITEGREMNAMYRLRPGARSRLAAATRRALGR